MSPALTCISLGEHPVEFSTFALDLGLLKTEDYGRFGNIFEGKSMSFVVKIIIILRKVVFNTCIDNSELIVSEGSKESTITLYTNFITYILAGKCNVGFTVGLRANVSTETARPDD